MKKFILISTLLINACLTAFSYNNPTAEFSVSVKKGCDSVTVTFTNLSTAGDAPIKKYLWVFGNGQTSDLKTPPAITFKASNLSYIPFLEVTDENNVTNKTQALDKYKIQVSETPTVDFMVNEPIGCSLPWSAGFTFTGYSSTETAYPLQQFVWTSDLGTQSFSKNGAVNITQAGYRNITLKVTDALGCFKSISKSNIIYAGNLQPSFTDNLPYDTVCKDATASFTNTSTGTDGFNIAASSYWTLDDGNFMEINSVNASTAYFTPGAKSVTLTLKHTVLTRACEVSKTQPIFVEEVTPDFSPEIDWVCDFPVDIKFTDNSPYNITSRTWSLPGGGTSTSKTPTITFNDEADMSVGLTLVTKYGCTGNKTATPVSSEHAKVDIIPDILEGCVPQTITYSALVESVKGHPITKYKWSFYNQQKDTKVFVKSEETLVPNYQYQANGYGELTAVLEVYDEMCKWDSGNVIVKIGDTINPNFEVQSSFCASEKAKFKDLTTGGGITDPNTQNGNKNEGTGWKWTWDYGNGENPGSGIAPEYSYLIDSAGDAIATHPYAGTGAAMYKKLPVAGKDSAQLTVCHWGCCDSVKKKINIKGPYGYIDLVKFDCAKPKDFTFTSNIIGGNKLTLEFGDGSSHVETFGTPGNYSFDKSHTYDLPITDTSKKYSNIKLISENTVNGCKHEYFLQKSASTEICITNVVNGDFTVNKTKLCWDEPIIVNAGGSSKNTLKYIWSVKDLTPDSLLTKVDLIIEGDSMATFNYKIRGNIQIKLGAESCNLCKGDTAKIVKAYKPYVSFEADKTRGCFPDLAVKLTPKKIAVFPDTTYVKYTWNFDKGGALVDTNVNPINVLYGQTVGGVERYGYAPKLTIKDALGCIADSAKPLNYIYAYTPKASVFPTRKLCEKTANNLNVAWTNQTNPLLQKVDSVTWLWGDGKATTYAGYTILGSHNYADTGIYTVTVRLIDQYNCKGTATLTDTVFSRPKAGFYGLSGSADPCYPDPWTFTDTSKVQGYNPIVKKEIDPQNYGFFIPFNSTQYSWTYLNPGKYKVRYRVETSKGCSDTAVFDNYAQIAGPYVSKTVSPDPVCRNGNVQFKIDSISGTAKAIWHFDMDPSTVIDIVKPDTILSPVNNSIANFKYVRDNYRKYKLELIDPTGKCVKFFPSPLSNGVSQPFFDSIFVRPLSAVYTQPDSACGAGNKVKFNLSDTVNSVNFTWDFGDGTFNSSDKNVEHAYVTLGTYDVKLITRNLADCGDTVLKKVTVYPVPNITNTFDSIKMCPENNVTLVALSADNKKYEYVWIPTNGLTTPSDSITIAKPTKTTQYFSRAIDLYSRCHGEDTTIVYVQEPPHLDFGYISPVDGDSVYRNDIFIAYGDTLFPFAYPNPAQRVDTIIWENAEFDALGRLMYYPKENGTITLFARDTLGCEPVKQYLFVTVKEGSLDLPTAFTPNGDGLNDEVKVAGWGLKARLIKDFEYVIFNRWGEEVFRTKDFQKGWDGTYKGKMQNIDTYVFNVMVVFETGQEIKKTGTIKLMK